MIRSDGGDVNVDIAIVVIVADGATESVHLQCEPGLPGDVGKGSVFIVVIERGKGFAGFVSRPVHGIDEENILPSIIVIIQEASAAAHGLREIFFSERAIVVLEVNACLGSDIVEVDGTGGTKSLRSRVDRRRLSLRRYCDWHLRRGLRNGFRLG